MSPRFYANGADYKQKIIGRDIKTPVTDDEKSTFLSVLICCLLLDNTSEQDFWREP